MKKSFIKKTAAAVLAATLTAMSAIGVCATPGVDTIDTSKTASLTIYKYDLTAAETADPSVDASQFTADGEKDEAAEAAFADYALKGVEFTYLKVGDINTDTDAGSVGLLYDLPTDLETALGITTNDEHKYTSDEINEALSTLLENNTSAKNTLEAYVASHSGTSMTATDASGKTSASGLAQGLYLVVETKVPEEVHTTTDPFFVSLPMTDSTGDYWNYDVVVYPKNQTNNPTIDKVVREEGKTTDFTDIETASEGDVLDYRIVTKLPHITSTATYLTKYTFVDTLSAGIDYNKDTYIAFYSNESDAKNGTGTPDATWAAGSGNFAVSYDDAANTMTVSMTSDGLAAINPSFTDKYMAVIYKATVNSDAAVVLGDTGNPNDVTLTYSRTNTTEENTIEDKANVYAYGLNLTKTFSDGNGDMSNVQFVLQNSTDGYYMVATGSDGVYYITDGTHGAAESDGTVFTPASDGKLIINGLEADTYVLTEIHTDDGYSLLKEPMTIVISPTVDSITPSAATVTGHDNPNEDVIVTAGDRASATVDGNSTAMSNYNDSTNARVDMSVLNTNSFTLPQTGGRGLLIYTMAGAAVLIAVIAANTKKSKKAE